MENWQTALKEIAEQLTEEFQREMEWVKEAAARHNLATIENRLRDFQERVRAHVREGVRLGLGTGYAGTEVQCACGKWMKYLGNRGRTVLTLFGPLELSRAYYWCKECGTSRTPLDERLDIVGEGQSKGVQMTTALLCALVPNATAMEVLERLGVPHVSEKESQLVTLAVGRQALAEQEEDRRRFLEEHQAPSTEVREKAPERLAVSMDGTSVHTDGEWHEAKIGSFYEFDAEGRAVGQKTYVTGFRGVEHFRDVWDTEAQRWHVAEAKVVVALCDGAPWTWNTVGERCPAHVVEVLDFYHAAEHLGTLARGIWGEGSARVAPWVEDQKTRLLEGHLGPFFSELARWTEGGPWEKEGKKQLAYFETNRHRIRYKDFRAKGYPIGSGVVEAACKTVIGHREKQPGMRWRSDTAEAVGHLRAVYESGRWDRLCSKLSHIAREAG